MCQCCGCRSLDTIDALTREHDAALSHGSRPHPHLTSIARHPAGDGRGGTAAARE